MAAARFRLFAALFLFFAAVGSFSAFSLRGRVVVVTDASFEAVYGPRRAAYARAALSLRLFRAVRRVPVADSAPSSAVVLAATAAGDAGSTFCVLFPPYFAEAAAAYAAARPGIPAVVALPLFSEVSSASLGGAFAVAPDPRVEGFRAGQAVAEALRGAARSAGNPEEPVAAGSRILVRLRGDRLDRFYAGFEAALAAAGARAESVAFDPEGAVPRGIGAGDFLVDASPDYPRPEIDPFAETPQIVYSWSDPALLPPSVVRVFDDSIYALAPAAVLAALKRGGASSPARSYAPTAIGNFLYK